METIEVKDATAARDALAYCGRMAALVRDLAAHHDRTVVQGLPPIDERTSIGILGVLVATADKAERALRHV